MDEIFTIGDGVAVGDTGIVVSATNADGVGRLTFSGSSVATGTIGAVANRLGLLTAGINVGSKTVAVSGNSFVTTVTNTGTDAAGTGTLNFGGNLTTTTLNVVSAGATAAAVNNSTITGNLTATAVNVTGAANAGANASLTLNGATNALGTATLTDGVAGLSTLTIGSAAAQNISGNILGAGAGQGGLVIDNTIAAGAVFSGTVGATTLRQITIEHADGNSTATFQNTVGVAGGTIKLGGDASAADINTLVLDGQTQIFTVTGAITGTATELDNISVIGGRTITLATAGGANLDSLSVTGTDTMLTTGFNLAPTAGFVWSPLAWA